MPMMPFMDDECDLCLKWLAIPHPALHPDAMLELFAPLVPPYIPGLEVEMQKVITVEQAMEFEI